MKEIILKDEGLDWDCPFCRKAIEKLRQKADHTPYKGDFFCCPCGGISILSWRDKDDPDDMELALRKPNGRELKRMMAHPEVREIIGISRETRSGEFETGP